VDEPLVVTLDLFPPERNLIPAHLTLFHHLPGAELTQVLADLRTACARPAPNAARQRPALPRPRRCVHHGWPSRHEREYDGGPMQAERPVRGTRYEDHYVLWAEEQAAALTEGRFADLDLPNLADEIGSLSGRDRRELTSRLGVLLCTCSNTRTGQSERRVLGS
jgi:uncharacterized protein DUF29